jgi:hypothetical protein
MSDGAKAKDGFQALAQLDSNKDGKIDVSDDAFGSLKVWVDSNSDGKSEVRELKSLEEAGVASISLDSKATSVVENGNVIGLVSSYQTTDGSTRQAVDVWLQSSNAAVVSNDPVGSIASTLSDYLATPANAEAQSVLPVSAPQLSDQSQASLATALRSFDANGNAVVSNALASQASVLTTSSANKLLEDPLNRPSGILGSSSGK